MIEIRQFRALFRQKVCFFELKTVNSQADIKKLEKLKKLKKLKTFDN